MPRQRPGTPPSPTFFPNIPRGFCDMPDDDGEDGAWIDKPSSFGSNIPSDYIEFLCQFLGDWPDSKHTTGSETIPGLPSNNDDTYGEWELRRDFPPVIGGRVTRFWGQDPTGRVIPPDIYFGGSWVYRGGGGQGALFARGDENGAWGLYGPHPYSNAWIPYNIGSCWEIEHDDQITVEVQDFELEVASAQIQSLMGDYGFNPDDFPRVCNDEFRVRGGKRGARSLLNFTAPVVKRNG